jgi:hypothetical protein
MPTDEEVMIEAGQDESFGFGAMAAKGAIGTGLLGASTAMMRGQTPGGVRLASADYARNFLPGFYGKGGILHPKARQGLKYASEGVKTAYRLGKDATFGFTSSEFYNKTGVSPVLLKNINEIETTKNLINDQYLKGQISKSQALTEIKKAEKIAFFKASSDKANRMIFLGKSSKELDNIVGDAVKQTGKKDFIHSMAGNRKDRNRIANYVFTRQDPLTKAGFKNLDMVNANNMKFIKYSNIKFADVLRGAQFDRNVYSSMLSLKSLGKTDEISSALNMLKGRGIKNAQVVSGNKVVFSVSPSIKPNYDWGGYNSVAIWDKRRPDKIRLIATDVPNTPVPLTGGKVLGIKYVDSKEISITDKKINNLFTNKTVDPARREAALRGWETRRANQLAAGIKPLPISDDLLDRNPVIGKGRYQKMQDLMSKRKNFSISTANRLSKLGRRLPGALGLAMNAWALYDMYKMTKDN